MRIVLIGTVGSTLVTLKTMVEINVHPIYLFTLDSIKSKRHSDYVDLKPIAKQHNIPVKEIVSINDSETLSLISSLEPDVFCKYFLPKVANHFSTMLQVENTEHCKLHLKPFRVK